MDYWVKRRDFLYLMLYIILIYTSLPFTPACLNAISRFLGHAGYRIFMNVAVALPVITVLVLFERRLIRRKSLVYLGMAAVLAGYAYILYTTPITADKTHLIEYGILTYLALRFMRGVKPRALRVLVVIAIVFTVGYVDEFIQKFVPGRVSSFEDVMLNLKSGILAVALLELLGLGG